MLIIGSARYTTQWSELAFATAHLQEISHKIKLILLYIQMFIFQIQFPEKHSSTISPFSPSLLKRSDMDTVFFYFLRSVKK